MSKKMNSFRTKLKYERSKKLFDFIKEHKGGFSKIDLDIVSEFIVALEVSKISSVSIGNVGIKYIIEPDMEGIELITINKTNYDIWRDFDLYTHTMNVVDETISYIYGECDIDKIINYIPNESNYEIVDATIDRKSVV